MPQRNGKDVIKQKSATREEADKMAGLLAFDSMIELVQSKRKFFFLNFMAGLWRGVGGVVGVALAVVLIGYIVSLLGGLPLFGGFLRDIQNNIPSK